MTAREFGELFRQSLCRAADAAAAHLGRPIPHTFGILRGSPGPEARRISVHEASSELWLSEDRFYRVIDLAVTEVSPSIAWIWVRESGHAPSAFDATWNDPPGSGPFKVLIADTVRDIGSSDVAV